MYAYRRLNPIPAPTVLGQPEMNRPAGSGQRRSLISNTFNSCVGVGLGLGLCLSLGTPLRAAEAVPPDPPVKSAQYSPPTPPNLGAPKGRISGGASRGGCAQYPAMQALMPQGSRTAPWSLTTSERPTFWFYLPGQLRTDAPLEFVLQDPDDQYIYKTVFTPPSPAASVISIELPLASPPLVPGLLYSWTLSLSCDPSRPSQVAFIQGSLQRSPLASTPAASQNLGMAQQFAAQGFWYDALTLAAKAYQSQPTDAAIARIWQQLLQQVGLEKMDVLPRSCCGKIIPQGEQTALSPE